MRRSRDTRVAYKSGVVVFISRQEKVSERSEFFSKGNKYHHPAPPPNEQSYKRLKTRLKTSPLPLIMHPSLNPQRPQLLEM